MGKSEDDGVLCTVHNYFGNDYLSKRFTNAVIEYEMALSYNPNKSYILDNIAHAYYI